MNFALSDEQKLLRDTVREFARNEVRPVAEELDREALVSYLRTHLRSDLAAAFRTSSGSDVEISQFPGGHSNLHHGGLHLGGDMCEIPTQGSQVMLGWERLGPRKQGQQGTEPRQRGEVQVSAPHWPALPRPARR